MSQEINLKSAITSPQYAAILNSSGLIWNTNSHAFESVNNTNWHYYAIPLVASGVGNNYYVADFPALIVTAGVYVIKLYEQLSTTPVYTDTLLVSGFYNWQNTSTQVASNWITLSALKTYLNITNTNYDAQLNQIIPQASLTLSDALRRRIALTFYYEALDGSGYSFLRTSNYPITSLTSITNLYSPTNAIYYAGSQFVFNQEGTIKWSPQTYQSPQNFASGFQNYLVAYQAGYNTVPLDLQLACMMYSQFLYNYSQRDLTIVNKHAKDVDIAYGRALMGDFTSDSVFTPIQAILNRYLQIGVL